MYQRGCVYWGIQNNGKTVFIITANLNIAPFNTTQKLGKSSLLGHQREAEFP